MILILHDTSGSILCNILNTSIMSPRNLLYFNVSRFKCLTYF